MATTKAKDADQPVPDRERRGKLKMPLVFEEALAALIEVKPEPKPPKPAKRPRKK